MPVVPETVIDTAPPASTVNTAPIFTFHSNDPLATFECNLDPNVNGSWTSCESPYQLIDLLPGQHEMQIRAKNEAGMFDASPASHLWTIGPVPDTAIISHPPEAAPNGTATFRFASTMQNVTFECAIDEMVENLVFLPCSNPQTYTDLIFGEHEFAVRARDAAGNVDLTPAEFGWEITGLAPPVMISSGPGMTTEDNFAEFVFSAPGEGIEYACALSGELVNGTEIEQEFSPCLSPKRYNGLLLGQYTFEVQVLVPDDAAEPPITTYDWSVVEDAPPTTTILRGPDNPSMTSDPEGGGAIATFILESNDPHAIFECALDGEAWAECPDPVEYTSLTPGNHHFRARAVDLQFNIGPSVGWTWEVVLDQVLPVTTITNVITSTLEGQTETIVSFHASEPVESFDCQIDNQPWEQCESPYEISELTAGQHQIRVRAIDLALNVGPVATRAFEVGLDATPPETTLDQTQAPGFGVANHVTPDDWATFAFTSNEEVAYFECMTTIEGELVWEECFSPTQYVEILPGQHTFQVRAVDTSFNTDPTPETWTWTYFPNTGDPDTTIFSGPPAISTATNAWFQFSAYGPEIEFECALDAEPFGGCESPELFTDLTPGPHIFYVRAIDLYLNVEQEPAVWQWMVAAPPLEPPVIEQAPPEISEGPPYTFTFSAPPDVPNATFECRLTPGSWFHGFEPCTSPHSYGDLVEGEYIFEVRVVNEYGIAGEIPAEYEFEVAIPPDTTILHGPSGTTSSNTAAFAFASSEQGSTFICWLDGEELGECLSPAMFPDAEMGFPEITPGTHTFEVQAEDIQGNLDLTPATRTWTVVEDGAAPQTRIDIGPPAETQATFAEFMFSANEASTFECQLDSQAPVDCTPADPLEPAPFVVDNLSVGTHTFTVVATDLAGNVDQTPATHTWRVISPDTLAPNTTIGEKPDALTTDTGATFTFTANEENSVFRCKLDSEPEYICTSPAVYTALSIGEHTFSVYATDQVGNSGEHARDLHVGGRRRHRGARGDDRQRGRPDVHLQRHRQRGRRADVPVQHRRAGVRDLHEPEDVHGPRGRPAHVLRARDRQPRQRVGAGDGRLRRARHDRPEHGARRRAAGRPRPRAAPRASSSPARTTSTRRPRSSSSAASTQAARRRPTRTATARSSTTTSPTAPTSSRCARSTPRATSTRARRATSGTSTARRTPSIIQTPPATTPFTTATFRFSTNEAGSTYECSLDGGAYATCSSPHDLTFQVAETAQPHTLSVRAKDASGQVDATPASYTWTILPPPDTTIDSVVPDMGVDFQTESTSATFTFSSPDSGESFECALDAGAMMPCTSPVSYSNLQAGAHSFEVQAVDAAGNRDPTPAAYDWEIGDLTPPVVEITGGPTLVSGAEETTNAQTATFTFTVDDPAAVLQCSLDGAEFRVCSSPKTYTAEQLAAATGQVDGAHTFDLQAVKHDLLIEAEPALWEWTIVDIEAPTTTIQTTVPAELAEGMPLLLTLTSNDPTANFECSLNGRGVQRLRVRAARQHHELSRAAARNVAVRAVDQAATPNVDATPSRSRSPSSASRSSRSIRTRRRPIRRPS